MPVCSATGCGFPGPVSSCQRRRLAPLPRHPGYLGRTCEARATVSPGHHSKHADCDHLHESSMSDSESEHPSADDPSRKKSGPAYAGPENLGTGNPDQGSPSPDMPGVTDTFGLTPRPRAKTRLVDPLLGVDLGGVKIVRLIGEGGMGRVYEAVQARPERTVAVKIIRQGILTEKTLRRFEREAEFLAKLQHPGIAQIYVVGTYSSDVGEIPFYVMEYLADAKPVTHYVDELNLSLTDRLRLFQQVCQAVSHGHDRGVVHRDLKPGNILIDGNGQPKVIDFGVARSTDSDLALTSMRTDTGQLVGTVQYMSPEQFGADPHDLDTRADVYALGVVLYELLAGEPPYQVKRKGIHEAAKVICEQAPTPLRARDKSLPREIEAITHRCLQKDRRKRYRTAGALAHDLGQFLAGKPIATQPTNSVVDLLLTPWRVVERRRALLAGLVLGAALALAGVMWATAASRRNGGAGPATKLPTAAPAGGDTEESRADRAARIKRELQPPLDPGARKAGPARDLTLTLTNNWTPSALRIERGGCYRLLAAGDFKDDRSVTFGPEGHPPAEQRGEIGPREGLKRQELQAGFVRGYPRLGIVARVGTDSITIYVGRELVFVAPASGDLDFRLNENNSARSAASGEARLRLEEVTEPEFVNSKGETTLCARVAGEGFLVFEPDGLRWRKSDLLGGEPEQVFPVFVNEIAWWPDRLAPFTSALLKTPAFSWASGVDGLKPVIQASSGMSPAAQVEAVEIAPGLRGIAFRWHGDGAGDVSCTIRRPVGR